MDSDTQDKINEATVNGNFHTIQDDDGVVLQINADTNEVVLWNEDRFLALCDKSDEPLFKVLATVFNLGIISGVME